MVVDEVLAAVDVREDGDVFASLRVRSGHVEEV